MCGQTILNDAYVKYFIDISYHPLYYGEFITLYCKFVISFINDSILGLKRGNKICSMRFSLIFG